MNSYSDPTSRPALFDLPFLKGLFMLASLLAAMLSGPQMACAEGLLDEPVPASWQSEAALNDVCFIDRQNWWAVGDHGTILRTTDLSLIHI